MEQVVVLDHLPKLYPAGNAPLGQVWCKPEGLPRFQKTRFCRPASPETGCPLESAIVIDCNQSNEQVAGITACLARNFLGSSSRFLRNCHILNATRR